MPTKTMAKVSSPARRSRAFCAISLAMRSCGSPPLENSGSFWPRTRLFMRSIAENPVSMKSFGRLRRLGLIGVPSMRMRLRAAIGGPPSTGCPTPLKIRPKSPGPNAKCTGSPRKRTRMSRRPSPVVEFEHFDHHRRLVERGDTAEPRPSVLAEHLHRLVEADFDVALAGRAAALRARSRFLQRSVQAAWGLALSRPAIAASSSA